MESIKKRGLLSTAGGALIAIGIFRVVTDSSASHFRDSALAEVVGPVTVKTDDEMVSAEFPQTPARSEAVDKAPGVRVHRITRDCDLEGGEINLRLSCNQYAPGAKDTTKEVFHSSLEEAFRQQGFRLVGNSEHPESIREFILDRPADGVRMVMRIWFGPEGIYRALATMEKGHHDDPRALSLMSSFRRTASSVE